MFFLSWLWKKYSRNGKGKPAEKIQSHTQANGNQAPVENDLSRNLEIVKQLFPEAPDLVYRRFAAGPHETPAALLYLDTLTDKNALNNHVIRPLIYGEAEKTTGLPPSTIGSMRTASDWKAVQDAILQGESALFLDGHRAVFLYDTRGWPQRAIEDPQLESSLKGAHQGFVETGMQNIALLRRYLPHQELRIAEHTIGRRGKSKVWIVYLQDVANPDVLLELEGRIKQVEIDALINTGELAELIEDNHYSPFPQFILTERPDSAISQLLQGRFVVIVDRSPSVIVAPAAFTAFFQSVDDYSTRWLIASFIRLLRFVAFFIALLLPAIYIAFISFNYEVIPLQLFISIAETRERVPFPPLLEAVLMEITLEMMREAGIRLPAPIGQTIGIVGGIVIGQAAVQAGIVSNIMVIVVATTAIASFILPSYDMGTAVRLMRFPIMIMSSLYGIIGIIICFMILVAHLVSLESLKTPYGSPLAPFRWADMKDTFIRFPLWSMIKRPKSTLPTQENRLEPFRPKKDPT